MQHILTCLLHCRLVMDHECALVNTTIQLLFQYSVGTCILLHAGRRVAELELHIALSHLIRNFEMEYLDKSPIGYIEKFLLIPEKPMDLSMKDI